MVLLLLEGRRGGIRMTTTMLVLHPYLNLTTSKMLLDLITELGGINKELGSGTRIRSLHDSIGSGQRAIGDIRAPDIQ